MKTTLLILACAGTLLAADVPPGGLELPNGTKIIVENGKVRVETSSKAEGGNSSASSNVNVRSENGRTVATVTSERNGRRETRVVVIGPDGKATVSEAADDKPAAEKPAQNSAWLGVNCADMHAALRAQVDVRDDEGIVIEHLAPEGPAAKAGLAQNNLILALNKQPVGSVAALRAELSKRKPGEMVFVDYLRKGRRETARLTLAERAATQSGGVADTMDKLKTDQPGGSTEKAHHRHRPRW